MNKDTQAQINLTELQSAVTNVIINMDRLMKAPKTPNQGKEIGFLINLLQEAVNVSKQN